MTYLCTYGKNEYPLDPEETLLHNLKKSGILLEYQCQSGYCGSCRCLLRSGHIAYKTPPMAALNTGEVLPCIAYAQSNIHIER